MKRAVLLLSLVLFVLGGLIGMAYPSEGTTASPAQTPSDNTGRNVRDRGGTTLTPGDQSENEADRTLTQQIRKAVVSDDSLSITAKNVKIITQDGLVTLRGPVNSPQEKQAIEQKAHQIAGMNKVDSQLEVTGR
jgi:osmotically-inducible protein OsmY